MAVRLSGLLLLISMLLAGCGVSPVADGNGEQDDAVETSAVSARGSSLSSAATSRAADMSAVSGRWAADPIWCTDQGFGSAIVISVNGLEENEDRCQIADLIDGGDGSFTARLSCEGDDQIETELVKLTPDGEQLSLTYLGRDDPGSTLTRCD